MATAVSKRLFVEVAAMLKEVKEEDLPDPVLAVAARIARIFKSHNGRFDRERFLAACGYGLPPNANPRG